MRLQSTTPLTEPREAGFVLDIDGRAVLALAADNLRQARKLCAEPWFSEEMAQYQSNGAPLWPAGCASRVRRARPEEVIELQVAVVREEAEGTYDQFVFAFLVAVDLRAN